MSFQELIKRLFIDIAAFFALALNLYFLYSQMIPFLNAALALNYLNGQTICYMAYSVLLMLFPAILLFGAPVISKPKALRILFYAFAAVLFAGSVSDLISYNFFLGYTFIEGHTVFVNIMWNMPNIWGVLFSLVIATLYALLAYWIKKRRKISYFLYLSIFILSVAIPLIYTYFTSSALPRDSWMQKAVLIIPEQFLILISLSVCASSRSLWKKHVWN